jgi:hypothetical protein
MAAVKSDNRTASQLRATLADELDKHEHYLSSHALSEGDRQRQGLTLTNARYFISVLENHILKHTASVVFTIELAEDYCILRFCRPLTMKEYDVLLASNYVPMMRSKVYLSVGLSQSGGVPYAWVEVKLSQYSSVIDLFDALFVLGKELENYMSQ